MIFTKPKTICVLEHEDSSRDYILKILKRNFPKYCIDCEIDHNFLKFAIATSRPDIMICDWTFDRSELIDNDIAFAKLMRFPGLVVIFSANEPEYIADKIIDKFAHIPKNFRIIHKVSSRKLVEEIKKFEYKKAENFSYPYEPGGIID